MPIRATDMGYERNAYTMQVHTELYCRLHVDFPVGWNIPICLHLSQVCKELVRRYARNYYFHSINYYNDVYKFSLGVRMSKNEMLEVRTWYKEHPHECSGYELLKDYEKMTADEFMILVATLKCDKLIY